MQTYAPARMFALLSAILSLSGPAAAQTPDPSSFRARTDLVEVDVVVQDRSGAFVTDLKPEDFELLEEGRPQKIQQLYVQMLDGRRQDAPPPESGSVPRIFVVVFDEGHMSPAGFRRTQEAASTFFSQHLQQGDLGGVVVNGMMVNDRITNDRSELVQAVKDAKPSFVKTSQQVEERQWPRMTAEEAVAIIMNGDAIVLDDVIRRACSEDPDQCRALEGAEGEYVQDKALHMAEETRVQSLETLQVLRRLMEGLSKIDGRKSVLLMSEGFITDSTWPLVAETEEAAARANARIYTLDARGLERVDASGRERGGRPIQAADSNNSGESMNMLASHTGGFTARNTLEPALKQISSDAGNYYVLGHRPPALDGEFHRLTVRVKRPGVSVRARSGYVASVVAAPSSLGPISARPLESGALPVEGIDSPDAPRAAASGAAAPADTGGGLSAETNEYGFLTRPDAAAHLAALEKNGAPTAAARTGWDAYSRGDLSAAVSSMTKAAADAAAGPWVLYALGHIQYGLKEFGSAGAAWERVMAAAPDFKPVYFDLADAYMRREEFDRAARLLRQASQKWPADGEIVEAIGVISAWQGALDDAVTLFERSIAMLPDNASSYFNLGKALELRYYGSRHYDDGKREWVANEADRTRAAAAYDRAIALGGPFVAEAREGLSRLEWMTK